MYHHAHTKILLFRQKDEGIFQEIEGSSIPCSSTVRYLSAYRRSVERLIYDDGIEEYDSTRALTESE